MMVSCGRGEFFYNIMVKSRSPTLSIFLGFVFQKLFLHLLLAYVRQECQRWLEQGNCPSVYVRQQIFVMKNMPGILKNGYFSLSTAKDIIFWAPHCGNLICFLEVKVMKVWGPPKTVEPAVSQSHLSSHTASSNLSVFPLLKDKLRHIKIKN